MGCCSSAEPVHAYYEPTGELIRYEYPKKHSPKKELAFVSANDLTRFQPNDICYVISAEWHSLWLDFATKSVLKIPPTINNYSLVEDDHQRMRKGLKHKRDYRPISKAVWQYLFKLYGGGPVIIFKVPEGFSEESYLKGNWIKKVELSQLVTIIQPCEFPTKSVFSEVVNPMGDETVAANNAALAANLMLNDLSRQKFAAAKELTKEINASNAEAIGAMMAKDMGKRKMEEAKEVEKQQHLQQSAVAANLFAGNLSNKRKEEAKVVGESAKVSQQVEAAALFSKGAIKKQFRAALAAGRTKDAQIFAATMLKNAWRGKKARQQVRELKAKKQRLLEEAMARKLQSKYRSRLARKKVEKLKAEKQRLREEGCAIILQSNWRIKKARDKVAKLKIERQRLLEEGAALKVQSRWRIRQARQKVGQLRTQRQAQEAKKSRALMKIIQFIFLCRAKLRYRKLLQEKKQIFIVHLKRAQDINVGDVSTSDPYVLLHVESQKSGSGGATVSVFRSKVIYATLNPEWNEDIFAVNATAQDLLVLTMMDKDNFTSDDFLGQTIIPIGKYPGLYDGRIIDLSHLPINAFSVPIRDVKGKPLSLSQQDTPGKGTFSLSIRMAPPHLSQAGWVMKQAGQLISLGSSQFKPRFLVLLDGVLRYYDNEHTLDHARGTMKCADVVFLNYGLDKHGDLTLQIQTDQEDWYFRWMEGENEQTIKSWLNKLGASCTHVRDRESFVQRTTSVSSPSSTSQLPVVDVKNTGKLQKRASFLFGGKK